MALIVEDGSQVTNSNSYVSRADYIAYTASIGVTITDDETADQQLVKAAEYIDGHEVNLIGTLVDRDQSMAFPRTDLFIQGWFWSSDEIPKQVKEAQMLYALDINSGEDLYNRSINENRPVTKERIEGVVDVTYAANASTDLIKNSKADSVLSSLLKSGSMTVQLVRALVFTVI